MEQVLLQMNINTPPFFQVFHLFHIPPSPLQSALHIFPIHLLPPSHFIISLTMSSTAPTQSIPPSESPPSTHEDQRLTAPADNSHPSSEIQEVSEEEFYQNVDTIQEMVKTCARLRIPKSIRDTVNRLNSSLSNIKKQYHRKRCLPHKERLSIRPSSSFSKQPLPHADSSSQPASKRPRLTHSPVDITPHLQITRDDDPDSSSPNTASNQEATPPRMTTPIAVLSSQPEVQQQPASSPTPLNATSSQSHSASHQTQAIHDQTQETSNKTQTPSQAPAIERDSSRTNATQDAEPVYDFDDEETRGYFTIVYRKPIRKELHAITQSFMGQKSPKKLQLGWDAVKHFLELRLQETSPVKPPEMQYISYSANFEYGDWVQQIREQATDLLRSAANEPWWAPDIINVNALHRLRNKSSYPLGAPPLDQKTSHPESNLVRLLFAMEYPTGKAISKWARTVAFSVQTVADELCAQPPQPLTSPVSSIKANLQVVMWLQSIKTLPSSLQPKTIEHHTTLENVEQTNARVDDSNNNSAAANISTAVSAETRDCLEELRSVIIDIMISFSLLQAHSLKDPKQQSKKKSAKRKDASTSQTNSCSLTISDYSNNQCRNELVQLECRHNFLPFVFYLLSGIRGIFIASRDRRTASICDCQEFLCLIQKIQSVSDGRPSAKEPIWAHMQAYIKSIMLSISENPQDTSKFRLPTRHDLAKAIAHDYLNYMNKNSSSTMPFSLDPSRVTELPTTND